MNKYKKIDKKEFESKNRLKKKTKKKLVYRLTSTIEYKTLEAYLSEMAAKGLMVIKITSAFITFEKCEPRELDFNVGLFYKSTFASVNGKEEQEYRTMCKESGWRFVFSNERFQIFYKEKDEEFTPIYTDDEDEYKIIKRIFFKTDFAFIVLILIYLGLSAWSVFDFNYRDLYTNMDLYFAVWPMLLLIPFLIRFFDPVLWLIRNKRRLNNGLDLSYPSEKQRVAKELFIALTIMLVISFYLFAILSSDSMFMSSPPLIVFSILAFVGLMFVTTVLLKYLKRIDVEPLVRFIIFILVIIGVTYVYMGGAFFIAVSSIFDTEEDKLVSEEPGRYVMTLEQLGVKDNISHVSYTEKSSLLLKRHYYVEGITRTDIDNYENYIRTETLECKASFIASFVFNSLIEEEKKRFEYRNNHTVESMNINNHIYEIKIDQLEADSIYLVIDEKDTDLVIKQGNRIIVIESTHDLLKIETIKMIQDTLEL